MEIEQWLLVAVDVSVVVEVDEKEGAVVVVVVVEASFVVVAELTPSIPPFLSRFDF
jgi:hypothetical protein